MSCFYGSTQFVKINFWKSTRGARFCQNYFLQRFWKCAFGVGLKYVLGIWKKMGKSVGGGIWICWYNTKRGPWMDAWGSMVAFWWSWEWNVTQEGFAFLTSLFLKTLTILSYWIICAKIMLWVIGVFSLLTDESICWNVIDNMHSGCFLSGSSSIILLNKDKLQSWF